MARVGDGRLLTLGRRAGSGLLFLTARGRLTDSRAFGNSPSVVCPAVAAGRSFWARTSSAVMASFRAVAMFGLTCVGSTSLCTAREGATVLTGLVVAGRATGRGARRCLRATPAPFSILARSPSCIVICGPSSAERTLPSSCARRSTDMRASPGPRAAHLTPLGYGPRLLHHQLEFRLR